MIAKPHPQQEERLRALRRYDILDTPREKDFDDIAGLVARICECPVSVINFIDSDRQWFKAETGLGVRSTPLETSLCSHAILGSDFVEIPDTLADSRMCDNPLCVAEGGFRFYAGALLKTADGLPLGSLCVLDTKPRTLDPLQRDTMRVMAERVMSELDLRLAVKQSNLLRKEIDHRVKNSLASVGAIVALQASRSTSEETRSALDAIQSRLGAMEALHEELHQDDSSEEVDLGRLIERAVAKLGRLVPDGIAITTDIEARRISSPVANAIALTVNEFVTNSAKHAFAEGRGTISIAGSTDSGSYRLVCSDDGIGDSTSIAHIEQSRGLGSRIIRTLAASVGATASWRAADPGIELLWVIPAAR